MESIFLYLHLTAHLYFATPKAESTSGLRLLFAPTFTIDAGETVTLVLPSDFEGKPQKSMTAALTPPYSVVIDLVNDLVACDRS